MDVRSLLNRLEAWARDELAACERTNELLTAQERAIVANRPQELERATRELEAAILREPERGRRRNAVIAGLAAAWGVPARAMTLGSIAERVAASGGDAGRLARLRDELRAATGRVLRQNRRVAALGAAHRRLVQDVIQTLFRGDAGTASGASPGSPLSVSGTLLDAEA
jgi:hypothetical protein